jgi:hypothetical protein
MGSNQPFFFCFFFYGTPAGRWILQAIATKCDGEGEGLFGSQGIQEGRVSERPEAAGRGG